MAREETNELEPELLLAQAHEAAGAGQSAQAVAIARGVLDAALKRRDERMQAQAMVAMANCELRVIGQFRLAYEHAQRAAFMFERSADTAGECAALGTLAIAATHLAQHEDAVESGLLGVRLAEGMLGGGRDRVMAYHCLGLASYYAKSFDQAASAYEKAIAIAHACEPPLNVFQLKVNQAVTECLRYFNERALHGVLPSLDRLASHVADCDECLLGDPGNISLTPASHWNNLIIKTWAATLLNAWQGNAEAGQAQLDTLDASAARLKLSWLGAAVSWARAELGIARGDLPSAAHWARDMHAIADCYGHEALCMSSHQLASHIHELNGDFAGALGELQKMARREQRAKAKNLKRRTRVIDSQIELREQKMSVKRLERDSLTLGRLALEDPLTGLANRRQFEMQTRRWLSSLDGSGLYVAIVDVDQFKQVNDGFSHAVGDAVLATIGRILVLHMREDDLAARLGGDEFAITLHRGDAVHAEQILGRIARAVREFDWTGIAPGLAVSISAGGTLARPGDSLEALLVRADAAMYGAKRAARH